MHWQITFITDAFTAVRNDAEKQNLDFSSDYVEVYNRHFCMEELLYVELMLL